MTFSRPLTELQPRPPTPPAWSPSWHRFRSLLIEFVLSEGCSVRVIPRVPYGLEIERGDARLHVLVVPSDVQAAESPGRYLVRNFAELQVASLAVGLPLGGAS